MKWIELHKKKPKNQDECLVAFEIWPGDAECGYCMHLATYVDKVFYTWELSKPILSVTHWMPLPECPGQMCNN